MATREEIEAALKAADAAGNTEDARRLAAALSAMPTPPKETPNIDAARAAFSQMPWYAQAGQAADDVVRMIANGITLGGADRLAGNLPGGAGSPAAERAQTEEARGRAGSAAMPAEIIGMLLPGSLISRGVGGATGMTARTWGESAIREGLTGAIMGGTQAAMGEGDVADVLEGSALGGAGGFAGGILSSKLGDVADWAGRKLGLSSASGIVDDVIPPKTPAQMKQATDAAYQHVDRLGTRYDQGGFNKMVLDMADELNRARLDPEFHPNAARMLNQLQQQAQRGGNISPRDLDDLRRVVSRDVTGTRGEGHMAGIMKRHLDDFIKGGPTTTGATSESAAEASRVLGTARDAARRGYLLEDINKALYQGENAASPRGDINALRRLLNNPKKTMGMSGPEREAMQRVVRGSGAENLLRKTIGNMPISPLGLGSAAGYMTGNPFIGVGTALAVPAVDAAAEAGARKYTDAHIQELLRAVAGGSTTPSALRGVVGPLATAGAVRAVEQDRGPVRRKRRDRNRD